MLFPTIDFAIFFAVAFTANWLLNPYPRPWKLFMIAASYLFYSWWDWRFIFLLAASTAVCIEDRHIDLALVEEIVGEIPTLLDQQDALAGELRERRGKDAARGTGADDEDVGLDARHCGRRCSSGPA